MSLLHPRIIDDLKLAEHGLVVLPCSDMFSPLEGDDYIVYSDDVERTQASFARFSRQWLMSDRSVPYINTVSPQPVLCEMGLPPKTLANQGAGFSMDYAFHVDAQKLAHQLTAFATARSVAHHLDNVVDVDMHGNGHIAAERTESGKTFFLVRRATESPMRYGGINLNEMERWAVACLAHYPKIRFRVRLDSTDKKLVDSWHRATNQELLFHARSAELAALRYYQELSSNAIDVSVLQVKRPHDRRWETHDIEVYGRPIDVKNARVFQRGRYVSHFVKRHKQSKGNAVTIVGVTSRAYGPGRWINSYNGGDEPNRRCTIVGEINLPDIEKFQRDLCHLGTIVSAPLDMVSLDINRIAGWLLEYPNDHYKAWTRVHKRQTLVWRRLPSPHVNSYVGEPTEGLIGGLKWAQSQTEALHESGQLSPWLAGWAAARSMSRPGWCGCGIPEAFRCQLEQWVELAGLSRRSLFWFVCLFVLANQRALEEPSDWQALRRVIFPPRSLVRRAYSFPFGLHDPGRFIWSMFKAVRALLSRWNESLTNVTRLELRSDSILYGHIGQKRHTILAHCGGCGNAPLIAGSVDWCGCDRGRLKCNHCGYCSEGCRHDR